MNIFDYAMDIEKEGEALYLYFAENAPDKGMKTVFNELSAQEKRHYKIFDEMKQGQNQGMQETKYLDSVVSIFAEWKNNKDKFNFNVSQAEIYRKALDIEKKSMDFYTESSKKVTDEGQKNIFLKIAAEEKKHYDIVENIIDFIIKPERWVEHAEFSKIGEQY